VLEARAREVGASLEFVREPFSGDVGLAGSHQRENAALAVAALRAAGISIPDAALRLGLATVQWPGRFQKHGDRFVLDGGHNPHAAAQLVRTWREEFGEERPLVIFSALGDKDYAAMLETLVAIADELWIVPVRSARATEPETLAAAASLSARLFESLETALAEAAKQDRRVLVAGSLFLVGEALEILGL
jgi:dihydrofolate synthase/folylpolyglutamate synthase